MSRRVSQYDLQIEYIKQKMLDNEMSLFVSNRKIDRIYKQKYVLINEMQQMERTMQYLKEREILRKEQNKKDVPLTVEKSSLGFAKNAAANSSKKASAQRRQIGAVKMQNSKS